MNKNIIIGSDHAGFKLKNIISDMLKTDGYSVTDVGTFSEDSVDYPVIAKDVASKVAEGTFNKAILFCGTGIGMSIAANKVKGIRAVVCSDTTSAKFSRLHNNANILCLGQKVVGELLAKDICNIWLNTEFEGGRHLRRVNMLENLNISKND